LFGATDPRRRPNLAVLRTDRRNSLRDYRRGGLRRRRQPARSGQARLDHAARPSISVKGKPSDEIDVPEENVTEIHLNIDYSKYPAVKAGFGKNRFFATGSLYHSHTAHHLRAIVMLVSQLSAVK